MDSATFILQQRIASPLRVQAIETRGELGELIPIGTRANGSGWPPKSVLGRWWDRYPKGVLAACDGEGVISGAFGLWPVRAKVFRALHMGTRLEADLKAGDLHPSPTRCLRWYASAISREPSHRQSDVLRILLQHGLGGWLNEPRSYPLSIISVPHSDSDAWVWERLGFQRLRYPVCRQTRSAYRLDLASRGDAALWFHTVVGTWPGPSAQAGGSPGDDGEAMWRT